MRRIALVLSGAALVLAALAHARVGPPLELDVEAFDSDGVESTIVCVPVVGEGGLEDAAAILLGEPPPPRYRFSVAWGVAGDDGARSGCAAVTTVGSTEDAGARAQLVTRRALPPVGTGERGVRIRFDECPVAPATAACVAKRPRVFRLRGAGRNARACRTLTARTSPLARLLRSGGRWRVLKSRGRFGHARPRELAPALVDRVCGVDTARARRLGRELGIRAAPPAPAFQLATTATYVHRGSTSDVCVFVWTRPAQPPLRGSVTLSGGGSEQTKALTTLGGDAKTLVRFTVAQRDRYVADVALAGKTAQTAVELGLAPTTSGEFSCLP